MIAAFAAPFGDSSGQSTQVNFAAQSLNDPQYIFQAQGGLARFQINDKAHANSGSQRQPGLRQPELFACGTKCVAELLRGLDAWHE
jgi:hypothetical protein